MKWFFWIAVLLFVLVCFVVLVWPFWYLQYKDESLPYRVKANRIPVILYLWQNDVLTRGVIDRSETANQLTYIKPKRVKLVFDDQGKGRDVYLDEFGQEMYSAKESFDEDGVLTFYLSVSPDFYSRFGAKSGALNEGFMRTIYYITRDDLDYQEMLQYFGRVKAGSSYVFPLFTVTE